MLRFYQMKKYYKEKRMFGSILHQCMLFDKLCVTDVDVTNKRIMMRVDFDVNTDACDVVDMEKLTKPFITIKYLMDHNAKSIVLITHLGEPGGKKDPDLTLHPIADELYIRLYDYCGLSLNFLKNLYHHEVPLFLADPPKGTIALIENLRFFPEEEGTTKDKKMRITPDRIMKFRLYLKSLADIFVNEAFSQLHLSHSSMMGQFFSARLSGILVQQQLYAFTYLIRRPERPFIAFFGGNKTDQMLRIINNFVEFADEIVLSGPVAYTFLKEEELMKVGNSARRRLSGQIVREIKRRAEEYKINIFLPQDHVVGKRSDHKFDLQILDFRAGIPKGKKGMDIGKICQKAYPIFIDRSKTVLVYGPVGVIEDSKFQDGTIAILKALEYVTSRDTAKTIVIGRSLIKFAKEHGYGESFHVSSYGQATTEIMLGRDLPGIEALDLNLRRIKPGRDHNKWRTVLDPYRNLENDRS